MKQNANRRRKTKCCVKYARGSLCARSVALSEWVSECICDTPTGIWLVVTKDRAYILRLPFTIKNHRGARQHIHSISRLPYTLTQQLRTADHWNRMTRAHPLQTGHARARQRGRKPAHSTDTSSALRVEIYWFICRSQRFRSRPETNTSLANTIIRPTLFTRMSFVATRVRREALHQVELLLFVDTSGSSRRDIAYILWKYFAICSPDVNADSSSSVCVCLCVSPEIETKRNWKKKIVDFYQRRNQRVKTDSDFSVECWNKLIWFDPVCDQ